MRKLLAVVYLFFLFQAQAASAATVEGVLLEEEMSVGAQNLSLVGAGVRTKFFMDLYVGSLYAEKGEEDAELVMHGAGKAAIRLDIISSMITSEKMVTATREGFENSTGGQTEPIKKQIEAFINVFRQEIKIGDTFIFEADGNKVRTMKNGAELLLIDEASFRAALFGIWLSDKPADSDLKEAMLEAK